MSNTGKCKDHILKTYFTGPINRTPNRYAHQGIPSSFFYYLIYKFQWQFGRNKMFKIKIINSFSTITLEESRISIVTRSSYQSDLVFILFSFFLSPHNSCG